MRFFATNSNEAKSLKKMNFKTVNVDATHNIDNEDSPAKQPSFKTLIAFPFNFLKIFDGCQYISTILGRRKHTKNNIETQLRVYPNNIETQFKLKTLATVGENENNNW